ncbi:class I SAM-dependent methyltransferase [Streptomyces roseicoloratus]|uniref:class I SAM-dependent methyltransferase n=1 Tax=Streptomyces roseicoloratus TaxID=2508722 RepID=UPI001009A40C|nr:methyltransferase domain-containing protein [Streptomyces roseicoloratus]
MTPTLVPHHPARDWAEIQERMLVPLYEAVYGRLGVGAGSRVLGLGCGSGLALLMAAGRGARVAGVDRDHARVALARERLPEAPLVVSGPPCGPVPVPPEGGTPGLRVVAELPEPSELSDLGLADLGLADSRPADSGLRESAPYDVITAFHGTVTAEGTAGSAGSAGRLAAVTPMAEPGAAFVLAGWGPAERCATSSVLRVAARLTGGCPAGRDALEETAEAAGLRPDGSGRVACPFGYADRDSAVRGLLSTGEFDAAVRATDPDQVEKELLEALEPYVRADGTVWMANVFRYVIARMA